MIASVRRLLLTLTPTTDVVLPIKLDELDVWPKYESVIYVTPSPLFVAVLSVKVLFDTLDIPYVVSPLLNFTLSKVIFAPASTSTGPSKVMLDTVSVPL